MHFSFLTSGFLKTNKNNNKTRLLALPLAGRCNRLDKGVTVQISRLLSRDGMFDSRVGCRQLACGVAVECECESVCVCRGDEQRHAPPIYSLRHAKCPQWPRLRFPTWQAFSIHLAATAAKRYVPAVKFYSDSKLPRMKTKKKSCLCNITQLLLHNGIPAALCSKCVTKLGGKKTQTNLRVDRTFWLRLRFPFFSPFGRNSRETFNAFAIAFMTEL